MNPRYGLGARSLAVGVLLLGAGVRPARAASGGFEALAGSVRLPEADGVTIGRGRIVRRQLTPGELSEPLRFSVTLAMRDLEGLQARIASGGRVPASEMEAEYLPL